MIRIKDIKDIKSHEDIRQIKLAGENASRIFYKFELLEEIRITAEELARHPEEADIDPREDATEAILNALKVDIYEYEYTEHIKQARDPFYQVYEAVRFERATEPHDISHIIKKENARDLIEQATHREEAQGEPTLNDIIEAIKKEIKRIEKINGIN